MADLVVDTDVVSFGFRQDARYVTSYGPAIQGRRAVISFMTIAELRFGALIDSWGQRRLNDLQQYLERHYIRAFPTEATCEAWADLVWKSKQQGRIMSGSDAWIAATARVLSVPLVTHNAKHFRHLSDIILVTFPDQ